MLNNPTKMEGSQRASENLSVKKSSLTQSPHKIQVKPVDTSRDGRQSIPEELLVNNEEYVDFIYRVVTEAHVFTLDCDSIVRKIKQMENPNERLQLLHRKLEEGEFLGKIERQLITLSPSYLEFYLNEPAHRSLLDENMFESIAFSYAPRKAALFNVNNLGKKLALGKDGNRLDPYKKEDAKEIIENSRQRAYELVDIAHKWKKQFNLYISMFTGHPYQDLPPITPEDTCEELLYHKDKLPPESRIILSDTVGCADNPEKMHSFVQKIAQTISEHKIPNPIGLHLHTSSQDMGKLLEIFVASMEPFRGKREEIFFDIGMGAGGCPYAPNVMPNFPLIALIEIEKKLSSTTLPIDLQINKDYDTIYKLYREAQKVFRIIC